MKTSSRGYTIYEVMIVLAVTSVLFISAVTVFSGRRQKTEFTQSMYDLQSVVQSYANQVSTGTFPGTTGYYCYKANSPSGPRPELGYSGTTEQSTSQDCLYVGRVLQAVPDQDALYFYSVLGLREKYDASGADTGETVSSLKDAQPQIAHYANGGYKFTDKYSLLSGVKVVSAKYFSTTVTSQPAELLLLYTTFQNASANNQAMTAYTIPGFTGTSVPVGLSLDPIIISCVQLNSPCSDPTLVGKSGWKLCLQDSGVSSQKAELTVLSAATGITTKLTIGSCS